MRTSEKEPETGRKLSTIDWSGIRDQESSVYGNGTILKSRLGTKDCVPWTTGVGL